MSTAAGVPVLDAVNICKSFGQLEVLKGVTLQVPRGEVVSLIGPSGSGKSTFLRCLNLLEYPNSGSVTVNGVRIDFDGRKLPGDRAMAAFRANIGMVFQNFNLFVHRSVIDNVIMGPRVVKGMAHAEATDLGMELLEKVGLAEKAREMPERLSGGQKQRVAIARALAMKPDAILFDEATSALDPELVAEVLNVVRNLAEEGMTMVMVTHEIPFARDVADRLVFMTDGVIAESGVPQELISDPRTPELRAFLSHFHKRG